MGRNVPKWPQKYQTIKYTEMPKMLNGHENFPSQRPSKMDQNWHFWYEKMYTNWQPYF
jgi:hypothetical protein